LAAPARPAGASPAVAAAAQRRWQRGLLLQVLLCAVPPAALIALGQVQLAAYTFWPMLGLLGARLVVLGRAQELLCLLVATTPFINLLRGLVLYNIIVVSFAGALLFAYWRAPATVKTILRRTPLAVGLLVFFSVYYLISFGLTQAYDKNLRLLELVFGALAIVLVGRNRVTFSGALLGLLLSSWAVGLGMLPHNESSGRLGMIVVGGYALGNPAQLGLPLALGFLMLTVDRGLWVGVHHRPLVRLFLLLPTAILLALTTSRMSWLVAVAGLTTVLLFHRRRRVGILVIIILAAGAVQLAMLTPFGPSLQLGWNKTFNADRSAANRTSGRSDQWLVTYHAFTESPLSMLVGSGPGRGRETYARVSTDVEDVKYGAGRQQALHSLFMLVAIEAGLAGLLPVLVTLGYLAFKSVGWIRRTSLFFPPICLLSYGLSICTVAGNGLVDGFLLGTALLMTMRATPVTRRKSNP
jgi:O-antigen ligase